MRRELFDIDGNRVSIGGVERRIEASVKPGVDAAPTFSGCPDVHFFTKFLSKKWMRQSTVVDAASTEWTSVILDVHF